MTEEPDIEFAVPFPHAPAEGALAIVPTDEDPPHHHGQNAFHTAPELPLPFVCTLADQAVLPFIPHPHPLHHVTPFVPDPHTHAPPPPPPVAVIESKTESAPFHHTALEAHVPHAPTVTVFAHGVIV